MKSPKIYAIIGGIVAVTMGMFLIMPENDQPIEVGPLGQNSTHDITPDIQEKLEEIEKKVQDAQNIQTDYDPTRQREWVTSGPFQIDRRHYALGENIFLRVEQLGPAEKGQVVFLRPLNVTHYSIYLTIPFDGAAPPFNQYFTPSLSKTGNICSVQDIAGQWTVMFRGTDYENIIFTVSDKIIVPGEESRFKPVC